MTSNLVCDFREFSKGAGALPSPPDENDIIFEDIWPDASTFLCAGFDRSKLLDEAKTIISNYRRQTLWPRNQGQRPTCAAFTGTNIVQTDTMLSPEFIYYHRETKDRNTSHSSSEREWGMTGRDVMNILKKYGCPPESSYTYGTKTPPSKKVYNKASSNIIKNFYRVQTIDGVKQALISVGPVYVGLPMDKNYDPFSDDISRVEKFWADDKSESTTGHAVAIIGFDSDGFIFINSWGIKWGGHGYGRLPYEDFNKAYEYWCAVPYNKSTCNLTLMRQSKLKSMKLKKKKHRCIIS